MPTDETQTDAGAASDPRVIARGVLAVAAGWLVPGLGHVIVKRYARGAVFAVLIFASFALGMAHGGRLALRDPRQPFLSTLQVVANIGMGIPDAVARVAIYGELAYVLPADPSYPQQLDRLRVLRERTRAGLSIYGTAYLWTAGLMNLMLLFEVWDFATGRKD